MRARIVACSALAAAIALLAACGGHTAGTKSQNAPGAAAPAASQPVTPLQTCDVNVAKLLALSYQAMQAGQIGGLSDNQAAQTYGVLSPTFQAYETLNAALGSYALLYGTQASLVTEVAAAEARSKLGSIASVCLAFTSTAIPAASAGASAMPSAAPAASYAAPTPEATAPPGCPGSAALMAAWQAAPASAFQAQSIAPDLQIAGFDDISCWDGWVVASAITNANGFAVFGTGGGLHLLSSPELGQFNQAVCAAADSPADWKNPAAGPANCG